MQTYLATRKNSRMIYQTRLERKAAELVHRGKNSDAPLSNQAQRLINRWNNSQLNRRRQRAKFKIQQAQNAQTEGGASVSVPEAPMIDTCD